MPQTSDPSSSSTAPLSRPEWQSSVMLRTGLAMAASLWKARPSLDRPSVRTRSASHSLDRIKCVAYNTQHGSTTPQGVQNVAVLEAGWHNKHARAPPDGQKAMADCLAQNMVRKGLFLGLFTPSRFSFDASSGACCTGVGSGAGRGVNISISRCGYDAFEGVADYCGGGRVRPGQ